MEDVRPPDNVIPLHARPFVDAERIRKMALRSEVRRSYGLEPGLRVRRVDVSGTAAERLNRIQAQVSRDPDLLAYWTLAAVAGVILGVFLASVFGPDLNQWVVSHPLHLWGV